MSCQFGIIFSSNLFLAGGDSILTNIRQEQQHQRDAHNGVKDRERLPEVRLGRGVSVTYNINSIILKILNPQWKREMFELREMKCYFMFYISR